MIKITLVIFWQPVLVAEYKPTLAFYPQQTNLFPAIIASFSILLLRFHRNFLNFLNLLGGRWKHRNRAGLGLFGGSFFFFVILIFSRLDGRILETNRAEAIELVGAMEQLAAFAHGGFGFGNLISFDVHE